MLHCKKASAFFTQQEALSIMNTPHIIVISSKYYQGTISAYGGLVIFSSNQLKSTFKQAKPFAKLGRKATDP